MNTSVTGSTSLRAIIAPQSHASHTTGPVTSPDNLPASAPTSYPDVVLSCSVTTLVTRIWYAARFDEHELHFALRIGLVFNTLWDDVEFAGANVYRSIAKVDP